jgi:transcriptional regulator with XRE-family HTH domain
LEFKKEVFIMTQIAEYRLQKQLSVTTVAKVLSLPRNTYCHYERGTRKTPIPVLSKLADYYGVTVDELIGRIPPAPAHPDDPNAA